MDLWARALDGSPRCRPHVVKRIIIGIGGVCANHDGVTRARDDLSGTCRARSDRRAIGRGRWRAAAEPELNAGLVAEVALVLVSTGESVAEAGEHVIDLNRPDREVTAYWNV